MLRRRQIAAGILIATALEFMSAAHAAPGGGIEGTWKISAPQSSFVPIDGPIPFTKEGQQEYDANKAAFAKRDFSFDITQSRCSSPGVPRLALTSMPFRIWVRPRAVTFQYQWNRVARIVDMANRPIDPPWAGPMIGFSQGHWQGNTLAIKMRYPSDRTLIDSLIPHADKMVVDELWHLTGPNTLEDDITITDPDTFTRPWHTKVTFTRQPDEPFDEDVCLDRLNAKQMPLPIVAPKR